MNLRSLRKSLLRWSLLLVCTFCSGSAMSENPIRDGLPAYGIRDCHVVTENGKYYMVGTEIAPPGEDKAGISLYESRNMRKWKKISLLVDRKGIPADSWYKDGFDAPEIHKINGRYVLCFGGRNNAVNPYSTTETVIAVSKKIIGPYQVITNRPVVKGNRFTLWQDDGDGKVYAYWEKDGSLCGALMDSTLTGFSGKPVVIAVPRQFRKDDRFLDAPSVLKYNGKIYLFYTVFKGGYYAANLVADAPLGPWKASDAILFYRSEDQAPTQLYGRYADPLIFAPPCEIIGNVQLFKGLKGKWYIAYHSEDKYAEPFFCFDRIFPAEDGFKCTITLP